MRTAVHRLAFNRGLVSRLGLARADIKRMAMAAEVHTNWTVRVLGSMMLRPGLKFLSATRNNLRAFHIPFIFSLTQKALIEVTNQNIRVRVDDVIITRPSVATVVINGTFDANVTNWTDADEAGATSDWQAGGFMGLTGNGTAFAIRRQELTVALPDRSVEHGIHIIIERGPVVARIGSTAGDDDLVSEAILETGEHSLAATPTTGSLWIEFKSALKRIVLVDSVAIEAAGAVVVAAPWLEADLLKLRYDQSGDVIFVACNGYRQYRIERRSTRSWSVVKYLPEDGPFRIQNVTTATITASALSGNVTLTASKPIFKSTHVGALFQIVSLGQTVTAALVAQNTFSNAILVTGTGTRRAFSQVRTGVWVGTVTLQRSFDEQATWQNFSTSTVNVSNTVNDGLDDQRVWYRSGFETGDYTSGTMTVTLAITTGSITGVVRITAFTSSTVVSAEVITDMGGTTASDNWSEGAWSDYRGFPSGVAFHEGRLDWAGRDKLDMSISDAFDSFDPDFEGDAGPVSRTIGSGPVDNIHWLLSLQRLLMGAEMAEFSVRSSSLDEPITPTNCSIKRASTQGSAAVQAVAIDQIGVFVQRGGTRVYESAFGGAGLTYGGAGIDYEANELSALIPEIGQPGIIRIVVQRQPDTRIHCVRSDGTVAILVKDIVEQVVCWIEIETDGTIEDVVVLPGVLGDSEDMVYYVVNRTVNGATVRYFEKWALESQCRGGTLCMLADSFVSYTGAATTTLTAAHLALKNVVVWADGADVGTATDGTQTYTLDAAGHATLPTAVTNYVVGLAYEAPWKSAKLVEIMNQPGGSFSDTQIIKSMALILADVHPKGLKYGQSLTESEMQSLPEVEAGKVINQNTVRTDYSAEPMAFPGEWTQDARVCLLAKAPRPVTVLAALAVVEHHG